jgi:hypothetical protein
VILVLTEYNKITWLSHNDKGKRVSTLLFVKMKLTSKRVAGRCVLMQETDLCSSGTKKEFLNLFKEI